MQEITLFSTMDVEAVMEEKRKPTNYIVLIFNYTEDLKYKILQLLGVLNVIEEKSTLSENLWCLERTFWG